MEQITAIIGRRKRDALGSMILIVVIAAVSVVLLVRSGKPYDFVIVFSSIAFMFSMLIYAINAAHYPIPHDSYRLFNKIFYLYGSRLVLIASILKLPRDLWRSYSPFTGFIPSSPDQVAGMIDLAADVAGGVISYKQLKPAATIEAYFFNQQQFARVQSQMTPAPETPKSGTTDSSRR